MEFVEAIRDKKKIQAMKKILKMHSERDYLLFVFGINTGLKISEMLALKVGDVLEENGGIKDFLTLTGEDNIEERYIYLNSKVQRAIKEFLASVPLDRDSFLFFSPKTLQAISRQQAYRIINHAAKEVGIESKIGTHSLRKTFGYHAFKRGVAISLLQKQFHHSSASETLKYIGVSKSEKIRTEIDVNL
ncbi:tyrosine-type recombinase/integrase [Ferdinandcohnia quinoae]|uniref:Tyrosine-type recombinase/integrase n=1 Tax=Fredinandcohnia quinoae TaxID=2918902 RepID=A0AAW5EDE3_9BACI|nr:tyrosine-type recombinase/integrase [Fredinandcohnia sp. SECRCQ15]MCH1627922.1 tyrosine-type recombinase/integrase [Fredinandcohnia sp. SECRCQ15]